MKVDVHCGGAVQTNGYFVADQKGDEAFAVDAPEGMADWLESRCQKSQSKLQGLLLTHGHWDHILEAAEIQKRFKIPVWIHEDSLVLLEAPEIQSAFNPFYEIKACKADRVLKDEKTASLSNFSFQIFLCPGHCPGSLCFYFTKEKILFAGDVVFAGAVGRWDLPGGSEKVLFQSIKNHILPLPDDAKIYSGHGPSTTIGRERNSNPFLRSPLLIDS
jgi:hydroxyacylglutathione hydrolase